MLLTIIALDDQTGQNAFVGATTLSGRVEIGINIRPALIIVVSFELRPAGTGR